MKKFLGVLFIAIFVAWGLTRIVLSINFDRFCSGYLKRAADANTVELAKTNLAMALSYAEDKGLSSGYTSIIYRTPDEDVGFWYNNLEAALIELDKIGADATQLEKTNVLMKLRETLLDQGKEKISVTFPEGISVFPSNNGFAVWGFIGLLIAIAGALILTHQDRRGHRF